MLCTLKSRLKKKLTYLPTFSNIQTQSTVKKRGLTENFWARHKEIGRGCIFMHFRCMHLISVIIICIFQKYPIKPLWVVHGRYKVGKYTAIMYLLTAIYDCELQHLPYSPDLVPSEFHHFPNVNKSWTGTCYASGQPRKLFIWNWDQNTTSCWVKGHWVKNE